MWRKDFIIHLSFSSSSFSLLGLKKGVFFFKYSHMRQDQDTNKFNFESGTDSTNTINGASRIPKVHNEILPDFSFKSPFPLDSHSSSFPANKTPIKSALKKRLTPSSLVSSSSSATLSPPVGIIHSKSLPSGPKIHFPSQPNSRSVLKSWLFNFGLLLRISLLGIQDAFSIAPALLTIYT